ncbi:MAG: hypothetical protein M1836_003729 [Candelina mexicana]|nr:MAG: hypothetical protein M1836_003729 [Candelina mexicana]
MSRSVDEAEHSLEMHLPYIHKILSKSFPHPTTFPPLIPILVGSTSSQTERHYGRILAPYLSDPSSIFIISSDFCHWGLRFNYTYYLPTTTTSSSSTSSSTNTTPTINTPSLPQGRSLRSKDPPPTTPSIHESISHLDHLCMSAITSGSHGEFSRVLRETGNTVCGRHPIGVVMAAMEVLREEEERMEKEDVAGGAEEGKKGRFRFVRYERSSDCVKVGDSSVSYASGFAVL